MSTPLAVVVPSVFALVAYAMAAVMVSTSTRWVRLALLVGWTAHALAIGFDAASVGVPQAGARFGFAPALSVTLWLVLAVYMVESRFLPLIGVRRTLAVLGALAVFLAWVFPGESRPQVASMWAPLHWILGIASYGLFGAAVLHAAMLSRADRQMRGLRPGAPGSVGSGMPLMRLERLTFQFVAAGFAVLTLALLLGVWFTRPWRWDHKTVFSLLGWCVFAGLLTGRRAFGWRGPQATRWLYAGVGLLLLAYVGSRFVMEVMLQRPLAG